jgi:hypothetical protein
VISVSVPEWGGTVHLRCITGRERSEYEDSIDSGDKIRVTNLRERFLVRAICDDQGKRIFEENDIAGLSNRNGAVLDRLFHAALKLNKIGPDEIGVAESDFPESP